MWDDSLIVVAADHGIAFIKGRRDRRRLDRGNYGEIAPIPLFIKAPGQKKGKVNDAYVETIDILPTIFDILNINPKVKMDGRSAFSPTVQAPPGPTDPPAQHLQGAPLPGGRLRAQEGAGPRARPARCSGRAATDPRGCSASARTRN